MLPFLLFLGHNAVYVLVGFLCFCWLKHGEDEEDPATVQKYARDSYNIAALLLFFLFWTTCCDASKDKAGRGFGRARGDSRWSSCLGC
jgi:hypothetical protein